MLLSILILIASHAFAASCDEPTSVLSEGTIPPESYFFTGFSPSLTLTPLPYSVVPANCEITFSCQQLDPLPENGAPDMCSHTSGTSFSSIDTATGLLTLVGIDPDEFMDFESNYLVEIKGTVGNLFASNVFFVEFKKPCDVLLVIKEPDPFDDLISVYVTGPNIDVTWNGLLAT